MINEILELDKNLFLFLNNLGCECFDNFWVFITGKYSSIPLYILIIILLKLKYSWRYFILYFISILILITIIDMSSAKLIKPFFGRLRPYKVLDLNTFRVLDKMGGLYSFISNHSANSFGFSTLVYLYLKRYYRFMGLIFIWAFLTAYSRIYVGVHYPLDIIFGGVYGFIWAIIVYNLVKSNFIKNVFSLK